MVKIILFSDVHHATGYLKGMLRDNADADYYFFLGDGIENVMSLFPENMRDRLHAVEGNCDAMYQRDELVDVENKRFLLTHGNKYSVRAGLLGMQLRAEEVGANVACFGHTHSAVHVEDSGVHYINPGALTNGEYALVIVENGEVFVVPQHAKK